tara:strand:+ start:756 stop:1589 length:834 start_codon:yes stop_codon:yes gene_type:complete
MNVIGLGDAGCKVAEAFSQYPEYKIYKINVDLSGHRCYTVPVFESAEQYEAYDYPKIKSFFKGVRGETLFIIGGSGKISCGSLRILENVKRLPISILYIQPDLSLLDDVAAMQEKVVRNVLQEYARSGVFEKMCLVSNSSLEKIVGGAPVIGYFETLNELLVPSIHMINFFHNTKPVAGLIPKPKITHRLYTVGIFDIEKNEEKMFFSLDNARHKCYIYGVNEEKLKTDKQLMNKIKKQIESKKGENLDVSYAIYPTDYEYDIGYIIERSPYIQNKI